MIRSPFTHTYAALPDRFYVRQEPLPVRSPELVMLNTALATELGLNFSYYSDKELAAFFAGNTPFPGADPLAMAYAGHQFGHFVPQLGDGRALLLGEITSASGQRRDIHLKGSGRTAFSRQGDGRAALAPMLREYLISEAMHALGIPTTRALAVVTTGETVQRDKPLPGAILTRVAASHIRIGTFQYFAARGDVDSVRILTDYARKRHYPDAASPLEFLHAVLEAQARLIAAWLCVGFIHGVMNTDNMSISGETIDYGPCAFMDAYDPKTVFSSIDRNGRYAYANQPTIALWNLTRLAECLLPLLDDAPPRAEALATEALNRFDPEFETAWQSGMRRKLGLSAEEAGDAALIGDLLQLMQRHKADFTNTFRALYDHALSPENAPSPFAATIDTGQEWLNRWRSRFDATNSPRSEQLEMMRYANPFIIPRNHQVENALMAAQTGDIKPFETLHRILAAPYTTQADYRDYTNPPKDKERVFKTFCGT
ncbi:MAG: protein adenylyltransferase SelO [Holosporales bacterium]